MDFMFNTTTDCTLIYDIETFPNFFCMNYHIVETGYRFTIVDLDDVRTFLNMAARNNVTMVGFNNEGFDYPVIHAIASHKVNTVEEVYRKAMSIINTPWNARFSNVVWESDRVVKQLDLYKIHHFDNPSRSTSLKVLEINMKMNDVRPLPFDVGTTLTVAQKYELVSYCWHDIDATLRFYNESLAKIEFRQLLSSQYNEDFTNFNDTKIGKRIFQLRLQQEGVDCHKENQTHHDTIRLADCILPSIAFEHSAFRTVLDYMKQQSAAGSNIKGVFTNITATIDDFNFDFGAGGVHGSVSTQSVYADDDFMIIDIDVASYYPCLAISNRFYPTHLSEKFCDIYEDIFNERRSYSKADPRNAALKLALNGVYGDSNNKFSPFYDTAYTLKITINGQLLLCQLAERIMKIDRMTMIQINTDGLTVRIPREQLPYANALCRWWEEMTGLILEQVEYRSMHVRDVNNYIAVYTDGTLKSKGAYAHADLDWSKNHSSLIIQKAAELALTKGVPVEETIKGCLSPFDFLIKCKVPASSRLYYGEVQIDNITRYYVSTDGDTLSEIRGLKKGVVPGQFKRANKLTDSFFNSVLEKIGAGVWDARIHTKNKSVYQSGMKVDIQAGHTVLLANHVTESTSLVDLNHDWYIKKAKALTEGLI